MGNFISVTQPAGEIKIFDGTPDLELHKDCVYLPNTGGNFWEDKAWGIYNRRGCIIEAAAFSQYPGLELTGQSLVCPVDLSDIPYAPRDQYLYVGNIINHYGHFLLSSMSRLWALQSCGLDTMPLLGHGGHGPADWFSWPITATLFGSAGIFREDFAHFTHPVRIRELIIPYPGFVEHNYAYRGHAAAAKRWGDRLTKTQNCTPDIDLLYISKSKLSRNPDGLSNDGEITAEMERLGATIVYPEQLTIPQQVALFRRARSIAGQVGSAFHTMLLAAPQQDQRFIQINISQNVYSTNHAIVDAVTQSNTNYVWFDGHRHEREGANPGYRIADPRAAAEAIYDIVRS